jgi:hypothetical protein
MSFGDRFVRHFPRVAVFRHLASDKLDEAKAKTLVTYSSIIATALVQPADAR